MATNGDLARRLLAAAENDELMAKSVLPVPGVTDAGVGMLAQQAADVGHGGHCLGSRHR